MEYFIAAQFGISYLWFKNRTLPPLPLKEKKALPESEEYYPLFKDLTRLNWEHLRKQLAFRAGCELSLKPEFLADGKTLKRLDDVPDVLPFKLKGEVGNINWEALTEADKAKVLSLAESVQVRRIIYNKPIAVIYNPNSGTRTNVAVQIERRLTAEQIPYEMLPT
jgi:hypothetical protein